MSPERSEYHIKVITNTESPVDLLATETNLSRQKIKQAMQKGAVWVTDNKGTHRIRRHSKKLQPSSTLHFYYDLNILDAKSDAATLVCDEGEYSVWYKPRGMLSQGSRWGDHCAISRWVEMNFEPQRPAFTVHRLDRYASGLILIAHKKKTAQILADLFQKKEINKEYKVMVHGCFGNSTVTYHSEIDNKPAISHVTLLQYNEEKNISLLQVKIDTGRKHQIRLHLSEAGFPVIGDKQYGNKEDVSDLQLTAFKLSFISPIDGNEKSYVLQDELQPHLKN